MKFLMSLVFFFFKQASLNINLLTEPRNTG